MDFTSYFSKDVDCMQYSAIRRMAGLTLQSGIISFAGGAPSADTFPVAEIKRITGSILECDAVSALQYGLTLGFSGLIEAVVDFSLKRKILGVTSAQVAITSGSQQALDLIGRIFIDPGDVVFFELPSYVGGIAAFRNLQAKLVGVRQADDGIDLEDLVSKIEECKQSGNRAKIIYVIPNFQNPSGITLSPEKRKALLELAERFNLLVVEDDPYGEICFDAQLIDQLIPIKSMDRKGHVIYLSTFSKILSPGLRTGWVVASQPIIEKLDLTKQAADLCGSMLDQRIVAECWQRGIIQENLPNLRAFYRSKCQVMLHALEDYMPPDVCWTRPAGGLFVWVTLPDHLDSEKILNLALEQEKIAYVIGQPFHANGEGRNTLRLAFSKESEDNIRLGIQKLAKVFKSHLE